jgi:hypothetical protein
MRWDQLSHSHHVVMGSLPVDLALPLRQPRQGKNRPAGCQPDGSHGTDFQQVSSAQRLLRHVSSRDRKPGNHPCHPGLEHSDQQTGMRHPSKPEPLTPPSRLLLASALKHVAELAPDYLAPASDIDSDQIVEGLAVHDCDLDPGLKP